MSELVFHTTAVQVYWVLCLVTVLPLLKVAAPYGRHARSGWGPVIPARVGWVIMESPAVFVFAVFFLSGSHANERIPLVLFAVWQLHYVRRTLIYPFLIRAEGKTMPVMIAGLAFVFNVFNAYVNARWIGHFGTYESSWLTQPPFLVGGGLFLVGMAINIHSDRVLRSLRAPGEQGYKIPHGGLYRWISCPNYLGEIIEWIGWAVMTWSLAGAAFAVYTLANQAPRAAAHHKWYRTTFDEYPDNRKALLPGLW